MICCPKFKRSLVITRDSNASTVPDWDSLAHVNLVTAIEKKYKIRFALGELQELTNVADMIDLIEAKFETSPSQIRQ
jgi:acyl carrier protein